VSPKFKWGHPRDSKGTSRYGKGASTHKLERSLKGPHPKIQKGPEAMERGQYPQSWNWPGQYPK